MELRVQDLRLRDQATPGIAAQAAGAVNAGQLVADRASEDKVVALITSTVKEILVADAAAPGSERMLGRLMELLSVEVARRLAQPPPGANGRFVAPNDPIVGRALQFVHRDPARRWTVGDLAREAGSSRTVLTERFNAVMGQAPIEYVTGWRMQLAAERIRSSRDSLAAIATDVGYESEAAFNRAFKRVTGLTPGRWRDGAASRSDHRLIAMIPACLQTNAASRSLRQ